MNVPFPVRVAAGALAVGIDRLRTLPEDLPSLSVSLVGHAVRATMRVQQEIAQLAARGEDVLSPLTYRPQEHPSWAHFDDDETDAAGPSADDGDARSAGTSEKTDDAAQGPAEDALLADYDELRIAQVRARARALDEAAVEALLDYERAHRARPAFLTTLENRLTTLRSSLHDDTAGARPATGAPEA